MTDTRVIGDEELRPTIQQYQLVVLRGPTPGAAYDVKPTTHIGKEGTNDVSLADETVSRSHCVIVKESDGYAIRDLGSTNGTYVEDARIKEAYLRPGARIRVGDVVLRFQPVAHEIELDAVDEVRLGTLTSNSRRMREILTLLSRVAPTDATVLLLGETGVGKSEIARALHASSLKAQGPFVVFDCGAVSKSLIESELFGHEKGAFTGATQTRRGAMEVAVGGTLFLDELDDLPLDVQPKLLRALDEKIVYRVGSNKPIKLDVRLIAATKKDLKKEVIDGRFREDLYFRLSVVVVPIPPLRSRLEDLPLLVEHFFDRDGSWAELSTTVRRSFEEHTWPGNIRELRNVLERSSYTGTIDAVDGSEFARPADPIERVPVDYERPFKEEKEQVISRFERQYLRRILLKAAGNMTQAARLADIDRKYLYMLLKKHGMNPGEIPED